MARPNIVYLHAHDAGRYIQPYGYAVATPHLMRLAEQGMLFHQAFCTAPTCSPSRAGLLTGQSPHVTGMLGLSHRGFSLTEPSHLLPHMLREAGYRTILAGIQHVARPDERPTLGFDEFVDPDRHEADLVAAAVEQRCAQGLVEPFYLDVGCNEPHRDFPVPEDDKSAHYVRPPEPLPNTPETRRDMVGYARLAARFDEMVGRTLAALEEAGVADRTLIICTTDHGVAFPLMKCNLTDAGLGVLLMLRGPGIEPGTASDAMVSHLDIYPTICDMLGLDPPDWLEGHSLTPVIRGRASQVRDELFGEVTYHAAYEPKRCVRTPRHKYIRRYGDRDLPVLPNCDEGLSKDVLLAHGWAQRPQPREALYDLMLDPNERDNLIDDPAMAVVLGEMRQRLDGWMRRTQDPLLQGDVPLPPGGQANDPAGRSPNEPVFTAETPRE